MKKKMIILVLACVLTFGACIFSVSIAANAKYIVKGDTKDNIKIVQQRLKDLGHYTYTVDGIWGSRTTAAVKKFQKERGLVADGIVGAKTEKALGITLNSVPASATSSSSSDVNLLARCVYAEARGEPYSGMVAIAAVVLNRVRSSKFPNTIAGVIYEPWAFTCVNDGQINLTPNETAYKAAREALSGSDPTRGCLFYYNPATATSKWIWSLKVEMKIGRHNFARA